MKKYVFITQSISGITGNQRYVNNKCKLLRENGWEVIVLWNYNISPVQLEHVKCFDDKQYIHHELKFYPSWYTNCQRKKIIDRLARIVGEADQIVIESNKLELGAWGELLAKKLRCKHINFITSEGVSIRNKPTFDYCYAKLLKNEFFNINTASVKRFFSNFISIEHPEKHYLSASPGVEVEQYAFPTFDNLPKADFTITHFGRYKKYIPNVVNEIERFTTKYQDKTFNFFLLGNTQLRDAVIGKLNQSNVNVVFHPEVTIIPKQIFEKSNVVIGSAGCARIASMYMPYVIAMDVKTCEPLGLLRRTTLDSNAASGKYRNDKSVGKWLESILIARESYPLLDIQCIPHRFDYQMQLVEKCDYQYFDTTKVKEKLTRHDSFYAFIVKMGLFRVVEYLFFTKRGAKVFWR